MTPKDNWKALGWRHTLWDLVRFYLSLSRRKIEQAEWLTQLEKTKKMKVGTSVELPIDPAHVKLFFEYLKERERNEAEVFGSLRTEEQAIKVCKERGFKIKYTNTKNKDHHQSANAVVALVNGIIKQVCGIRGIGFNANPQSRCVWCTQHRLHVTVRNLDGAIPDLANPFVVWEVKEYWGGTQGGSKMSDAVYECNLVGRELREFEEATKLNKSAGISVIHIVFLDGLTQWTVRRSDLKRFVDLTNQGLIDYLLAGTEIETELEKILSKVLDATKK
jgi:hypothetical protein